MPTLRRLQYLIAIADHGRFHRAAGAVHVSQPTLSQQLRLLEDELGVVLVDRSLSGGELTPIGRDVAARARTIIRDVEDLKSMTRLARQGNEAGVLRFGVSPTIGPYLLPEIVSELYAEKPRLRVHIREGIPDEQVTILANGGIDLLLAPLPLSANGLHIEPLFKEPLRILASTNHPLARRKKKIQIQDLAGQGVLSLDSRHHLARQLAQVCDALRMTLLRDYEGTSLDSIYQMAASGLGLAVVPELYLRSNAGAVGGVRVLHVQGYEMSREIALLWRREAPYAEICSMIAGRIIARGKKMLAARGNA